jgi:hypothetical protein
MFLISTTRGTVINAALGHVTSGLIAINIILAKMLIQS